MTVLRFSGQDTRLEWWAMQILVLCALVVVAATDSLALIAVGSIAGAVLSIASCVRRLHDRGMSGSWFLFSLIPLIGPLWLLIECGFLPQATAPSRFGGYRVV